MLDKLENIRTPLIPYDTRNNVSISLQECENIARKTISKCAGGFAERFLADDAIIANIVTQIMLGDMRWNPSKSKQRTYRILRAKWAIRHLIRDITQRTKNDIQVISIPENFNLVDEKNNIEEFEQQESVQEMLSSGVINDREKDFIYRSFILQEPLQSIATENNLSRQRVDQIIKHGIEKLKDRYGNFERYG